jgi:hypothetical protein
VAGLLLRSGNRDGALKALRLAQESLSELFEAIGTEALQECYALLPDPKFFLAWLDQDENAMQELPRGSSDLEVFFG